MTAPKICGVLPLDSGTVVHERYRIVRPIGRGGMGAVYESVDLRLRNIVALKRMTAEGADADRAFEQEAHLLASLRHAGLPAVIDYFVDGGHRFLVMQYIEGEDLQQIRRKSGGRCARVDVLVWAVDILNVLSFLHRHDPPIVHRDIKPANIKLTPAGQIVLVDFGLAKGGRLATTRLKSEDDRSVYGFTPNYAPPEQQARTGTDARSDLYAVGATLYHLLTGDPPVAASTRLAAVADGAGDPLRPPRDAAPDIGGRLNAIILQALHLDAAQRFQSADDMIAALAPLRNVARERPRGRETNTERRVDAAMPSEAPLGRPIDLIVQVRFAGSPLLGLEDWPSKQIPDRIEQASEKFGLEYPVDPRTHRQLPARLWVKVVTADCAIQSTAECVIEVPPLAYSKRLAFLLVPRREGLCRVHVEVYSIEALHMGTVPIEVEATAQSRAPVWRVAHLVLRLITPDRASVAIPPDHSRPAIALPESSDAPTEWPRLGAPGGVGMASPMDEIPPPHTPARTGVAPSVARVEPIPSAVRSRPLTHWASVGAPVAILVVAFVTVVFQLFPSRPEQTATVVATSPRPAHPAGGSPVPASPEVPARPERDAPALMVAPPPSPPDPIRDAIARSSAIGNPLLEVGVTVLERRRDRVRVALVFRNSETGPATIVLDRRQINLTHTSGQQFPLIADSLGRGSPGHYQLSPKALVERWIEFELPETIGGGVTLTLAGSMPGGAATRFAALSFTLPIP
jgi:serine/threonine protein kinase